jgi:hypothetical protein
LCWYLLLLGIRPLVFVCYLEPWLVVYDDDQWLCYDFIPFCFNLPCHSICYVSMFFSTSKNHSFDPVEQQEWWLSPKCYPSGWLMGTNCLVRNWGVMIHSVTILVSTPFQQRVIERFCHNDQTNVSFPTTDPVLGQEDKKDTGPNHIHEYAKIHT